MWYEQKSGKKGSTEFVTDSLKSHFDIFYNLFLNRPTTTRNLFVLNKKEQNIGTGDVIYSSVY